MSYQALLPFSTGPIGCIRILPELLMRYIHPIPTSYKIRTAPCRVYESGTRGNKSHPTCSSINKKIGCHPRKPWDSRPSCPIQERP